MRCHTALAVALIATGWTLLPGAGPAAAADPPVVTADFTQRLAPRPSMTGVLHSFSKVDPPDARIAPLRLGLVRGLPTSAPYRRGVSFGARYTVVLSDLWGMPGSAVPWGGRGAPYADLAAWERFVERAARQARGEDVVWDIWNEPDHPYFWQGTRAQYHDTFRVAERALRKVLGARAFVIGPSTAAYRPDWFGGLVDHCRTTGCRVDALSWHEFPGPGGSGIPPMDQHLRDTRRQFVDGLRGADVGVRELHVNESLPQNDHLYPGEQLGTLALLEQHGADASARACWGPEGRSTCYDDTLDGLLTPKDTRSPARSFQPRAVWWATKRYADGIGFRVRSTSSRSRLLAIASRRAPDERTATVVLAYAERRGVAHPGTPAAAQTDVRVRLRGLHRLPFVGRDRRVQVRIERIPATGAAALTRPHDRGTRTITVRDGAADLTVAGVRLHETWVVRIKDAG
ncbi:MAG: hypothetical protein JHC84_03730 [Solirubrobacteraceae bacterium]|nr:hypothetical protein [Solirubrobacteraceae bacterium]